MFLPTFIFKEISLLVYFLIQLLFHAINLKLEFNKHSKYTHCSRGNVNFEGPLYNRFINARFVFSIAEYSNYFKSQFHRRLKNCYICH